MSTSAAVPLALGLGAPEIVLILVVLVLLFGAKKLPDLARGSGRALRIFKAETKGLLDDDEDEGEVKDSQKTDAQRQIDAQQRAEAARRLDSQRSTSPVDEPRSDRDH
jgi:sec-independent protein translocase protein TatA